MTDDESSKPPRWPTWGPLPGPMDAPPPPASVEAEFGACSQRGRGRSISDDHYLIVRIGRNLETLLTNLPTGSVPKRFDEYGYGMVVADGMGAAGELASRLAVSTLAHLAIYYGKQHVRVDEPIAEEMIDRAERFFRAIDATLLHASRNGPPGLQTTLTVTYTAGTELFFAHVGHSRAYLFRDGHLMRLTHDHTLDGQGSGKTVLMDVASSARDLHHIVTESLGGAGADARRIDIERCGLRDNDRLLLCTNGLSDVVDDTQLAEVLRSQQTPDHQCRSLVGLATADGIDDVTALVAHYRVIST
jgi:PPM family protein phosphatase